MILKKFNKFLILYLSTGISFLLFVFLFIYLNQNFTIRYNTEQYLMEASRFHQNKIFSINRIYFYSSADAKNQVSNNGNLTFDISQYTDIAIYMDNSSLDGLSSQNTIKECYLDNFRFMDPPLLGTAYLYYKNIYHFGSNTFQDSNILPTRLDYTIKKNSEEIDYERPELYSDLTNPITIGYFNKNIKVNYTFTDLDQELIYNGNLLKRANINLDNIACTLCFDITLTNLLDEQYKCPVTLTIPIKDTKTDLYSGCIKVDKSVKIPFYRIQ